MSEQNVELVQVTNSGFNAGIILSDEETARAKAWLATVLGEKSGIKSVQEGLQLIMKAKDLNVPFSSAIEHVHVIQGKTGVDVHILRTLLLRAGITWKCIKDYIPQYEYTDGSNVFNETILPSYCVICRNADEAEKTTNLEKGIVGVYPLRYYADANGNRYNEFQISSKCTICVNAAHRAKINAGGGFGVCLLPPTPVDYVAEYEFTRRKLILGEKVVTTAIGKFSYSEAVTADMFSKDTYKKYPKVMIKTRAWTYGAREIADDICLGLMETTELKNVMDVDFDEVDVDNMNEI